MNKLLKLKIKISKKDELLEKEMIDVALCVNLRNDTWSQLQQATKNFEIQQEKVNALIKQQPTLPLYINLNEKIETKRETLDSYVLALKSKKPSVHKKMIAERVERLVSEVRNLEHERNVMKKTNPVLMYIQETDELSKLQSIKDTSQMFYNKASADSMEKGEKFRKLMLAKGKLQAKLKKELAKNNDRTL